jgi:hypothetical protein
VLACEAPSGLVVVVVDDVCRGKGTFLGVVIGWRFCPHWYQSMEYHIVKWVLIQRCLPPDNVMILFRRVPQA